MSRKQNKPSTGALFLWAQGAALAGTIVDFVVMIFLTEVLGIWYVVSTAIGSLMGAISNFILGRFYVFKSTDRKIKHQAFRYFIVALGSLLINTAGVYLLEEYFMSPYCSKFLPGETYIYSRVIIAVLVAISFNFYLQKNYVYK